LIKVLRQTRLEQAVEKVLADGVRTADLLGEEGVTPVSTSEMGDANYRSVKCINITEF
jgi:isocitrate/isopropylmalate dehydrogenase